MESPCDQCEKTLRRGVLRLEGGRPFCFDCPRGYVPARFFALPGERPRLRSCRRTPEAAPAARQ